MKKHFHAHFFLNPVSYDSYLEVTKELLLSVMISEYSRWFCPRCGIYKCYLMNVVNDKLDLKMFFFHPPARPILCKMVLCKVTSNFPVIRSRTRFCPYLLDLCEAFDTIDNFLLETSSSLGFRKSALSYFISCHYVTLLPTLSHGPFLLSPSLKHCFPWTHPLLSYLSFSILLGSLHSFPQFSLQGWLQNVYLGFRCISWAPGKYV